MAEMVLTPPLRADGREPNFLQKFGHAFVHGDIFTKLSLVVWGLGYIGHGQLIKALLVTLVQGPALVTDFVKNVNNFNVIYLLTQDVYITRISAGILQRQRGGSAGHLAVPPDAGAVQLQDGRCHRHYGVHHLCCVHAGLLPVP